LQNLAEILIKVSEGKYAISARRGVLGLGGILVVYGAREAHG